MKPHKKEEHKMGLFKRNKKAEISPTFVKDYATSIRRELQIDETSFACIDRIATAFASLSYGVFDIKTKEKKAKNSVYELLREPNLEETHSLFFYQLVQDYYAGNVFLLKSFDEEGNVVSLFRLNPANVVVSRSTDPNKPHYKNYTYNGIHADGTRFTKNYKTYEILHIPSRFGYDGLIGHSIFKECAKPFETAHNLDNYTNNSFENSLGKRLVADLGAAFPDATSKQKEQWMSAFMKAYTGPENAGKPLLKEYGIQYDVIDTGVSDNRAAELTSSREFQQKIISQIFAVPVAYLGGEGNFDLENVSTMFITNALRPLCQAFEEAFNKLFKDDDKYKYYVEFNYNSALRTSIAAKTDSYTKKINNGQLTPNEVRRMENMPEKDGADTLFIGSNLMPLTKENIDAYMANSKKVLEEVEPTVPTEDAELAKTVPGVGSDKI